MGEEHFIVTIGREFGCGGKAIGLATAKALGVQCYDKELLTRAAKESGFCEEIFEHQDEKPTTSFLYSLIMDSYSISGYSSVPFLEMPLNHKVFLAQFDAIKKICANESCVIVGRCADYALAEHKNTLNVFIHANEDYRARQVMERLSISESKARDLIAKNDKQRSSYYNYYTTKKWGRAKGYHLSLDSSLLGVDGCVEMILKYKELGKFREG